MKRHLWPLALGSMLILIGATGSPTQAQEPEYGTFPPARQLTAQEILAFPTEQTEPVYKTVHPQTDGTSEGEASSWTPPDPADLPSAQRAFGYGPRLSTNFMGHVHHGEPADPHIAAGPDHLITVVNVQIKFWNKDGDNLQTTHLNDFFGVPGGEPGTFDPKVIYDKDSGRFFVLALAKNCTQGKSRYHLAASMTSNPMDGFHVYPAVDNMVANHWVDYPTLGVGERGLYIGGNLIPCSSPRTYERSLWVIDKSAVIAGLGAAVYKYHDVFPGLPTGNTLLMKAAVSWDSPTGVDNFVVSWNQLPGSVYQPMVWGVTVPGSFPSSAPTITLSAPTDSWAATPVENAPQAGGPARVQGNNMGVGLMNAVYRSGYITTVSNFGGVGNSSIRTISLDVSDWPTVTVANTQVYGNNQSHYFWPAIAANAFGDVVTVFSRSGTSEYVGSRFAMRMKGETALSTSQYLKAGEDYYGRLAVDTADSLYRWGDYGGACVDPVSEGFWIFHKYAGPSVSGVRKWRTWIGFVPRPVFVDGSHSGIQNGSRSLPYNNLSLGYLTTLPHNDFVIRTGTYPDALTFAKPLTIIPDGGPVTIGQ